MGHWLDQVQEQQPELEASLVEGNYTLIVLRSPFQEVISDSLPLLVVKAEYCTLSCSSLMEMRRDLLSLVYAKVVDWSVAIIENSPCWVRLNLMALRPKWEPRTYLKSSHARSWWLTCTICRTCLGKSAPIWLVYQFASCAFFLISPLAFRRYYTSLLLQMVSLNELSPCWFSSQACFQTKQRRSLPIPSWTSF